MFINNEFKSHVSIPVAINEHRDEGCDELLEIELQRELRYSIFSNAVDVAPQAFESSFDELEEACNRPDVRATKDGLAFCPSIFWPEHRKAENAKSCAFLAFDLDDLPELASATDVLNCIPSHRAFCYSTYSHREPGKGSRFRVVVDVTEPIPAHLYKSIAITFGTHFQGLTGKVDQSCASPAQMLYFPACPEGRAESFEFHAQKGKPLDWNKIVVGFLSESATSAPRTTETAARYPAASPIPHGERNSTLFKIGAALRRNGAELEDIQSELQRRNVEQCTPQLPTEEVLAIAQSAARYAPERITGDEETLTELALAKSVAQTYKGTIAWVADWRTWMRFNATTRLWECESSEAITRLLVLDLQQRRVREANLVKETGASRSKALREIERAERSGFLKGTENLLRAVTDEKLSPTDFDADQHLVGLPEGLCIDLTTATVRPIESTDYLTKSLSTPHDPTAKCPVWKRSITEWCCGDTELERFLQVWCGYSLSGRTNFQGFLFLYGSGRNGKSVFISVLSHLMNNYAMAVSPTTLMLKGNAGGATGDIARLLGARLVTSVELPEGKQFDENLMKQLTGGDTVTARHLYQSEFDFKPVLKLMIAGNHEPIVKGTDEGFWRRVNVVPFLADIPNPNDRLYEMLMAEQSGILNWCIEGWKIYADEGLVIPQIVKDHSAKYRRGMDVTQEWREQCVVSSLGDSVPAQALYVSYRQWSIENGFVPVTSSSFGRKLKPLLGEPVRKSAGKFYQGCRLK